ncbi:Vigilin [Anabarilius grahami]|uniref:Vigilin n=1 Tax=Anabarilius grahami TaxID=495550 RepID=A0A3N0XEC3_ANAGA|nr:Vigilin [Anabarilius grahami]
MIIEQRFHRAIIGQKGEKIKEVRDKFPEVIINFPDPTQKSDIVQLRGPRTEVEKCTKFMQKMVAEMVENSFSVSVPIFKQFHKNIIGKGGANIKKIREETNTKIDLPAENSNSEMIVITGKKANCEAAKNRILAIQKELANITEVEVSIPSKLHNSLIGSKGRFVRSIMEECGGVHIHFPTEGSGIDAVTIRGPAEEVEKAKKQLLSLAEEKQTKSHTVELRAKPEYHKFLIGKGGGNIRKVRDSTGARIIFPTAEDKDQELITVIGTEEAVAEAQKELEALIKSLDNVVEDSMIVDPKHHRFFVARRGQVLRDIADEYGGVIVSFPRTASQSDKVTLKGAKDCVEAAKKRMLELVDDLDAQVTMECVITQKFHRSIMGPKGSRIQQITKDHNVQIKFPDREDQQAPSADAPVQENGEANGEVKEPVDPLAPKKCDVIVLSGRKERCEAAVEALKALVPVTIAVEVPFELHRYIIGQKGSGIRKMMDEFEVNIQVPAHELQSHIISITGLSTHLDRAKEGLLERVKELQAEQEDRALRSFKLTITVDPKYHPKIIGRKGAIITQIRNEHEVNIQFPEKNDENQDQITITGYEQNAVAARDAIQAIVDELEEMISEDITLDSRVHARIIGARGKGIRKIMDEFKVDVRFPQSGAADPNLVTVTGRPEHVDEAIDHLLNLEEEYMSDVVENEAKMAYMKPSGSTASSMEEPRGPSKGFVVREAPWATGSEKGYDSRFGCERSRVQIPDEPIVFVEFIKETEEREMHCDTAGMYEKEIESADLLYVTDSERTRL